MSKKEIEEMMLPPNGTKKMIDFEWETIEKPLVYTPLVLGSVIFGYKTWRIMGTGSFVLNFLNMQISLELRAETPRKSLLGFDDLCPKWSPKQAYYQAANY